MSAERAPLCCGHAACQRVVAETRAKALADGAVLGRRATNDPGAFTKRGPDYDGNAYGERLDQWQTRALAAAIEQDAS